MPRKSSFLTFVLACLPGAGQMYLGYMHRGVSMMILFWGIIFTAAFFNFGLLCVLLPVVWAYAFFDTFNLRNQPAPRPDTFLFSPGMLLSGSEWRALVTKRHTLFGGLLIFIGIYVLYRTFVHRFLWDLYQSLRLTWLGNILDNLPTLIVAVLIILLGVRLVRGSGTEDADYVAFKGDANDDGGVSDDE